MKQATFKYVDPNNFRTIFGTVILKNDGKISISLQNGNLYSWNMRNSAKILARQIVTANFQHERVIKLIEDNVGLVKELTDKTQDLKLEYIEKCKQWAKISFIENELWLNNLKLIMFDKDGHYSQAFYDKFGIETEISKYGMEDYITYKANWNNQKKFYKVKNKIELIKTEIKLGVDYKIKKAEQAAINHYENSISKLSQRLNNKGITNEDQFIIKSSKIGQNFHCLITVPSKNISVKAWTIIAEGEIQQPHYRYLVK